LLNRISGCFRDIGRWAYWERDLDLSGSRDVIGHVTIRFPISHFLFASSVFQYKTHSLATIITLQTTDDRQTDTN